MRTLQESILSDQSDIIKGVEKETDIVAALGEFNKSEYYDSFSGQLIFSLTSWYRKKDITDDDLIELCEEEAQWNQFDEATCSTPYFSKWMLKKIFSTIANECECYCIDYGEGQKYTTKDMDYLFNLPGSVPLMNSYTYSKSDKNVLKWVSDFFPNMKNLKKTNYLKILDLSEINGMNTIVITFSASKPSKMMDGIFACMYPEGECNDRLRNKVRSRS